MTSLILLLLIVIAVLFWQASLRSRDLAIRTARETCRSQDLQFLDGTATLRQIRPYYSRNKGPGIRRIFSFDYSDNGIDRQSGCIIMENAHVSAVLLDE